jgi:glyoxylase-like metal-dependent hydrolase (beta-lactamase superfamily II)
MSLPGPALSRRELLASAIALASAPLLSAADPISRPGTSPTASTHKPACQDSHYSFTLGDFQVTALSDADAVLDGPFPIVGEDRKPAEVERLMRESLLPEKRFQPGFTPLLVQSGKELILFDTGNGANGFVPRPAGGKLAERLGLAGIAVEDIDLVVLSHSHPDHIGGLMEDGKPLLPRARYVMGETEHRFWSSDRWRSAPADGIVYRTGMLFQTNVAPVADRLTLVKPGGEITGGIHALEAYGHTPGHLAFHIESAGKRLLFWGDCAHHEVASLAHPAWHAFFDMDKEGGAATRRRFYDMAATERLAVAGYHTSFPSVGFVQKTGTRYRWIPVTYQFRV